MNEFNAVSLDELNQVEGGVSVLTDFADKFLQTLKDTIFDIGPWIRTGPLL